MATTNTLPIPSHTVAIDAENPFDGSVSTTPTLRPLTPLLLLHPHELPHDRLPGPPPAHASLWSRIGFYFFLIVFYVLSKGLSQLFASYVASREHLAAPIYLTTCEYAMWVLLGSIYTFTLEKEGEREMKPINSNEAKQMEDAMKEKLLEEAQGRDPESQPTRSEGRHLPLLFRRAFARPAAQPHIVCNCECGCDRCTRPVVLPQLYPSWRVTISYLAGEMIKTILEVVTVASVELSLALVLLATAPLFSILFRAIIERKKPKPQEICIVILVSIGLAMRIPEISSAPVGAVIGGLVSAASAAWISSFKSLIFDPPTAPHVLSYMFRFGPILCSICLLICVSAETSALKVAFRSTDESIETLSFGLLFGMLAAPSSVVSKRLQRLLGSFQRTLLGVMNNVLVAIVSLAVLQSTPPTALTIIGSLFVFASPAMNYVPVMKYIEVGAVVGRRLIARMRGETASSASASRLEEEAERSSQTELTIIHQPLVEQADEAEKSVTPVTTHSHPQEYHHVDNSDTHTVDMQHAPRSPSHSLNTPAPADAGASTEF